MRLSDMESSLWYAVNIIKSYELDMHSVTIDERSLAEHGICQGVIYREAITEIERRSAQDINWQHKFDCLIAAVFSEDDATRDRILKRAKELEAVEVSDDDEEDE